MFTTLLVLCVSSTMSVASAETGDLTHPDTTPPKEILAGLNFLAGEWDATFATFAATWGQQRAGQATGRVRAEFGPGNQWFEMVAETDLAGSGAYAVRVLLYAGSQSGRVDAFVVNSFGSHAQYDGHFVNDSVLVFTTQLSAKIQRVRYEKIGNQVRYYADESNDGGNTYQPHTESWWTQSVGDTPVQVETPYIAHIEIPAADTERTVDFYARAFGWSFQVLPDETGALAYWLATAGHPAKTSVTVGVYQRTEPGQPHFTVYAENIESAVEKLIQLGGQLDQPIMTIPATGRLAYVSDPSGNRFAIFEASQ